VSLWYADFTQVTDDDVRALMSQSVDIAMPVDHAKA